VAKVFIALPVVGGFYPQMVKSLFELTVQNPGNHSFIPGVMFNNSMISKARSLLAEQFMESDCEYLLSIDADIEFPPNAVDRLIRDDKDIIAAPYAEKRYPSTWALAFNENRPEFVTGVLPVFYVATGFTLVKRRVIEALREPELRFFLAPEEKYYHHLYQPLVKELEPGKNICLSEDFAFCQRAREHGFEIHADFDIPLKHWGYRDYQVAELDGKRPSHPILPFANKYLEMADVGDFLQEKSQSIPSDDPVAAQMQNMMESFAEIGERLKSLMYR
jgi:hypothetical protein